MYMKKYKFLFGLVLLVCIQTSFAEEYAGKIAWLERTPLTTAVSGIVIKTPVNAGDHVKKGALLLKLNPNTFNSKIDKAKAALKKSKIVSAEARREYGRAKSLFEQTLLSVHQLELVKIAYTKSQSDYKIAKANLQLAKINKQMSSLHAPYDAVVLSRSASVGTAIIVQSVPKTLITIARIDRVVAQIEVDLKTSKKFKIGNKAVVELDNIKHPGVISQISYEPIDTLALPLKYTIKIDFAPKSAYAIRLGQKVNVTIK